MRRRGCPGAVLFKPPPADDEEEFDLSDLVSHWKLDEASGTRVDAHGAHDLTDNNTVTQGAGQIGDAAEFAAANSEYLNVSHADFNLGDIDWTICGWVYLASKGAGRTIVSKYNGTGMEAFLSFQNAADRFNLLSGSLDIHADALGAPALNTWYFVVGWHDAAGDTLNIQVNDGTVDSTATAGAFAAAGDGVLDLGARVDITDFWDGRLDSISYWKRLLTSAERTALYNAGSGIDYPFN